MAEPRKLGNWMLIAEFPLATAIFIVASLNLAYRSIALITLLSALLLILFRIYLGRRYGIRVPFLVLLLAFAAVEIDTVGNHLRLYRHLPWPVPYDVFAHLTIPAMLAPALVWLTRAWFEKLGHNLPLLVVCFISVNLNFSLSGFYEIVELWDDLYFGGTRIWEIYDTSRDLQNGLLGAVIGTAISYVVLRFSDRKLFRQKNLEIGRLFDGEPQHVK